MRRYGPDQGLPSRRIRAIRPASGGGLWLGTEDRGLIHARFTDRRVRAVELNSAHGLAADHVRQILPDGRGLLWMSSNQGIFRAKEHALLDVVAGQRAAAQVVAYDAIDGMPHRECSAASGAEHRVARRAGGVAHPPTPGEPIRIPVKQN